MLKILLSLSELNENLALIPEEYVLAPDSGSEFGLCISDFAEVVSEISRKSDFGFGNWGLFEPASAVGGLALQVSKFKEDEPRPVGKKRLREGDVLVNRLRPYLKQVAYVDRGVFDGLEDVYCSPEFIVLRGKPGFKIAFLVPLLLSQNVQVFFASRQVGAHHPRITAEVVTSVRIPQKIVDSRDEISIKIERSIRLARKGLIELSRTNGNWGSS